MKKQLITALIFLGLSCFYFLSCNSGKQKSDAETEEAKSDSLLNHPDPTAYKLLIKDSVDYGYGYIYDTLGFENNKKNSDYGYLRIVKKNGGKYEITDSMILFINNNNFEYPKPIDCREKTPIVEFGIYRGRIFVNRNDSIYINLAQNLRLEANNEMINIKPFKLGQNALLLLSEQDYIMHQDGAIHDPRADDDPLHLISGMNTWGHLLARKHLTICEDDSSWPQVLLFINNNRQSNIEKDTIVCYQNGKARIINMNKKIAIATRIKKNGRRINCN